MQKRLTQLLNQYTTILKPQSLLSPNTYKASYTAKPLRSRPY